MAGREEMDEFVNWDQVSCDAEFPPFPDNYNLSGHDPSLSMDLALENVNDDEFGFFALQRFADDHAGLPIPSNSTAFPGTSLPINDNCLDTPIFPCANCASADYQCKTIREGKHKGYCTCCVALGFQCSLAGISSAPTFAERPCFEQSPCLDHPSWAAQLEQKASLDFSLDLEELEDAANIQSMLPPVSPTGGQPPLVAPKGVNPASGTQSSTPVGKVGARLSRESIRILRQWLSTHTRHPYPSDEEKDMLQRQTGLTKTQITNWLANARRRHKINPTRSTSPQVGSILPQDIPARRGTPALESMNPLQRWVDSPPEHEPASAIAIARAVTESSGSRSHSEQASPFSHIYTDDGSCKSFPASSASSVGTSHSSGGSFVSTYSHASGRLSLGSFGSFNRSRRRRRRRNAPKRGEDGTSHKTSLAPQLKTYQCTFCTETFKTKHDWQRHEKSLHLSLERWVCSHLGPRAMKPDVNKEACVFCGELEPSDDHIESHNYSTCLEKPIDSRTFYRKDHLNQHLKLVHNVKFAEWSMKSWKVATPEIRSRCGFCDIVMDTWSIRVDHLAEHFKSGLGMQDWKGDWGFDDPVLKLIENSIPPYLIHGERNSPLPYSPSNSPPETPRNAYELIKIELDYFTGNRESSAPPTDEELQLEACRIIFASEVICLQGIASTVSWLRDLIMSSEEIVRQAKFGPLRSQRENRLVILKINGKDNLFEACPLENALHEFVRGKQLLGLTAMDDELQEEACCFVGKMEEISTHPSEVVANWLIRMIKSSTGWLAPFRQRAHLPRSEDIKDRRLRPTDKSKIDSTIHNYSRLELELGQYMDMQRRLGIEPTNEDLQNQARIIIYEIEDGWNQTAADNRLWLAAFRKRHSQGEGGGSRGVTPPEAAGGTQQPSPSGGLSSLGLSQGLPRPTRERMSEQSLHAGKLFINDANCFRRLADELGRWAASAMSPNNPNRHIPSDEELQHQARWILYDDDDPWNQTAADNAEWLYRFKVDMGIIRGGQGLPSTNDWDVKQGGTGFAPPYAFPAGGFGKTDLLAREAQADGMQVTAETTPACYPPPAKVFCSRELEEGLKDLVQHKSICGAFPSDEELRERAKVILGTPTTAADNPTLLEKFKTMMQGEAGVTGTVRAPASATRVGMGSGLDGLELDFSGDMGSMLMEDMDMNFNFMFDTQDTTMGSGLG
ncbi:related to monocarboxylate transporter 4 [Cephalotrichum gorgonifer]|uniref:Related to monocarboxylate transporter 4 n=1 Tax=Cephalotrichum gorgonifer TaxID=2041049 RepID=A0AAE8MSF7_9PEZI|nr:related to monocarboxylate transporter 4 [Cephalotrichum gorgonifer]